MIKKKAFITGIGGQDGSYLAEHLLDLGYEVHGIVRRNSTPEHQDTRLDGLNGNVHIVLKKYILQNNHFVNLVVI